MKKGLYIASLFALCAGAVFATDDLPNFVGGNTDGSDRSSSITSNVSGSYFTIAGGNQNANAPTGNVNGDITLNLDNVDVSYKNGFICGGNLLNYLDNPADNPDTMGYVSGKVTVNFNSGTLSASQGLYGGNAGGIKSQNNNYVGSVEMNLNGGNVIGNNGAYVAGSGAAYSNVKGDVVINMNAGEINEIIGVNGAGKVGGKVVINAKGGKLGKLYAGGQGVSSVIDGGTNILLGGDVAVSGDVYAGGWYNDREGNRSTIKNGTKITLTDNATVAGTINGGGVNGTTIVEGVKTLNLGTSAQAYNGTSALKVADFDKINVSAGSTAQIESITQNLSGSILGTRTSIAKGGKLEVKGDVVNNITNATNEGSFVGGLTGGEAVVTGTVKTVIDGENTALHFVYGGNGGNQQTVSGKTVPIGTSKVGAVDLTVNNGKIDMIVASGAMYSDVDGNVNLNINGGDVGSVYGAASGATIGSDVNISVQNATVSSITAGGCGISHGARPAVVNGSTNIVIGSNAVISNNVYGGGWGEGASWPSVIKGDSNITLVGNATVGGTITGTGWSSEYDTVEGVKTLNLGTSEQAYNGTSALKVANFDKINVSAGSSAELFEYAQSDGRTDINIASNSSLSIVLGSAADQLSKTGVANDGTFSLKRGSLADGTSVKLSSYAGEGAVNAFGGTFADGVFTAGESAAFDSSPITVGTGANDVQTVKLGDKLALDFDVAGLGKAALSVNEIKASTDLGGIKGDVLAAFDVDLNDNSNDYTVVFSAYVGSVEDASKLLAWHKDADGDWTKLDTLIDYADKIASITVDSLGSYAFSQVPEPATYAAIFGALALAFAAYRRRK